MFLNTKFSCVLSSKCSGLVIKHHLAKRIVRMDRVLCSSFVLGCPLCLPFFSHFVAVLPSCRRRQQIWITNAFLQNCRSHRHLWSFDGLQWRLWVCWAWPHSFYSIWFSVINTKESYWSVVTAHQDKPVLCVPGFALELVFAEHDFFFPGSSVAHVTEVRCCDCSVLHCDTLSVVKLERKLRPGSSAILAYNCLSWQKRQHWKTFFFLPILPVLSTSPY